MNLEDKILKIIETKEGNKELAIFYSAGLNNPWSIEIGNPSSAVCLGESTGELWIVGKNLIAVVDDMLEKVTNEKQ